MKKLLPLLFFALLLVSNYASAQVNVYPLTKDFRMIPYPLPKCAQIDKIRELAYQVNDTYWIGVSGPILIGCPGVKNITVEIHGVKNVTYPQYNLTVTLINATVKTGQREYRPLGLMTRGITIDYERYNETYEMVTVEIKGLEMYWSYAVQDYIYHSLNPLDYGFPANMTIRFLINRLTGEGYLLDNGTKRYIGVTPFWTPMADAKYFPKSILHNLRSVLNQIETNPWVAEDVIQKAKLSKNVSESSELISSLASNLTNKVMLPSVIYLGRTMFLNYYSNRPDFIMPLNHTYLIRTYQTGSPNLPSEIDNMSAGEYVKKVLTDYLKTKNESEIKKLILTDIIHREGPLPVLYASWGSENKVLAIDFTLPPSKGSNLLVLPLPSEYAKAFNAPYLMLNFVWINNGTIVVKYDPSLYTPQELLKGWRKIGICRNMIQSTLMDDFMNTLNGFEETGVNVSALEKIYSNVEGKLRQCGFNVTGVNASSPTSSSANISRSASSQSASMGESRTKGRNHRICGPAILLALSVIPLLRRRLKR
ncbi:CGP-CTERM sorting domain-containing protein [Thermococcus sp.]|uniref:CGP-CTERM sorting domain-containing protein n=2 Tax=Thermococcus sp. TaxID=35749 RepID=UPI0026114602|nr:CGP-CTERM sorting domain-containing protein [Thermococcus sp.]